MNHVTRHFTRKLIVMAVALTAAVGAANAQQVPVLTGRWASEALENYGTHFATRMFDFTDAQWSVVYVAYADAQGKQPLFRLNVGGFYVLGQPSSKVDGAFEGIFPALRRHITAQSDAGVMMFASMGCDLKVGIETPLVNRGCGFVPGVMQAMGEYDLVARKGDRFYFGDRAGDLTKARPDRLTSYALTKR